MKKYIIPTITILAVEFDRPINGNDMFIGSLQDAKIGDSDTQDGSGNNVYIGGAKERKNFYNSYNDDDNDLW